MEFVVPAFADRARPLAGQRLRHRRSVVGGVACPDDLCSLREAHAPLFRVTVDPSPANGLKKRSQVMVDKLFSAPRANTGARIGTLDAAALAGVDDALRLWMQL